MSKVNFCLGTAKLDNESYGFSSNNTKKNIKLLFKKIKNLDINYFDTSPRYNNSEKILGQNLYNFNKKKLYISTKIDDLSVNNFSIYDTIYKSINESIESLNVTKINLCYLHQNSLSIISDKYILDSLNKLKKNGLVDEIGASVYDFKELDFVIKSNLYDWVQIPINILDTSFYFRIIEKNTKIKIAARSIFLQGLIINQRYIKSFIKDFEKLIYMLNKLKLISEKYQYDFNEVAIAYIFSLPKLSTAILGSTSAKNIEFNYIASKINLPQELILFLNNYSKKSKPWTNPHTWINN